MKKYPRTYHLPFSPEVHNDDKIINEKYLENFINKEVVITEKMDGQNQTFKGHQGVFARSHDIETQLPWDTFVKNYYYSNLYRIDQNVWYIFENLFAIHSIEYENLDSYMHMFMVMFESEQNFGSWDDVKKYAESIDMKSAPELFRGTFKSLKEIEAWMNKRIKEPSTYGKETEGFVIRNANSFPVKDFHKNVAKYVRKGHVQTDEHWTKNWKKHKLNKDKK